MGGTACSAVLQWCAVLPTPGTGVHKQLIFVHCSLRLLLDQHPLGYAPQLPRDSWRVLLLMYHALPAAARSMQVEKAEKREETVAVAVVQLVRCDAAIWLSGLCAHLGCHSTWAQHRTVRAWLLMGKSLGSQGARHHLRPFFLAQTALAACPDTGAPWRLGLRRCGPGRQPLPAGAAPAQRPAGGAVAVPAAAAARGGGGGAAAAAADDG